MAPPQHRADAPIVFIYSRDPAWDQDRFVEECKALSGDALAAHPVAAYLRGSTRGDVKTLSADGDTVESYLDGTEERVELKRLRVLDVARFRDQSPNVGRVGAAHAAFEGDVNELAERHGVGFVFELGEFALRCSEAPRPGEHKRSGS